MLIGSNSGFVRWRVVLDIAGGVACMAVIDAPAKTRNIAERFSIEHRFKVGRCAIILKSGPFHAQVGTQ